MIKINQHAFDCNQMMCRVDKQLQLGNLIKLAFCENWNRVESSLESLVLCARLFCNDGLVPLMCHLLQHKRHHRRERSSTPFHPNPPVSEGSMMIGNQGNHGGMPAIVAASTCCHIRVLLQGTSISICLQLGVVVGQKKQTKTLQLKQKRFDIERNLSEEKKKSETKQRHAFPGAQPPWLANIAGTRLQVFLNESSIFLLSGISTLCLQLKRFSSTRVTPWGGKMVSGLIFPCIPVAAFEASSSGSSLQSREGLAAKLLFLSSCPMMSRASWLTSLSRTT